MNNFAKYAAYYDLLYQDKDYIGETNYIESLIRKFHHGAKTILDLGCGTGKHATLLAAKSYQVHGVDLSEAMLAETQKMNLDKNLVFTQGDVRFVRMNIIFDVVISLFHVMSYQITNKDLEDTFQTVFEHLAPGGILIFDCWYGPAVLTDRPTTRIKRLENEKISVIRIAEPIMHANENIVDVNYQIIIKEKGTDKVEEIKEIHHMRYLFKPELCWLLEKNGFELLDSFEFMSGRELGYQTWNGCFIVRKRI